ncbi:hypothetical protein [Paracoccus sp. IB05]|uniref:hypothetical protein n=1 Tax=Paracoccus sp. IB05 TaxID=2779367 RepID=UPI0018E8D700|nr:hypothetical protein [Paracoccus sp. IB05]MBJ2150633.1 hypothetical protein [Paracoccus sp. IB05]
MGNPFRGEVSVGGGAHRLVCDFNALCEIEAHFGGEIDDGLDRIDSGDLGLQDQRAVVAALLRHHAPAVTLRDAGVVIADYYTEIHAAVRHSISLAMPETDPGKKPQALESAEGSGWQSSSRPMSRPGWIRRIFGL